MSTPTLGSKQEDRHVHFAKYVEYREIFENAKDSQSYEYSSVTYFIKNEEEDSSPCLNKEGEEFFEDQVIALREFNKESQQISHQWAKLQYALHELYNYDRARLKALGKRGRYRLLQKMYLLSLNSQAPRYDSYRFVEGDDLLRHDLQTLSKLYKMMS